MYDTTVIAYLLACEYQVHFKSVLQSVPSISLSGEIAETAANILPMFMGEKVAGIAQEVVLIYYKL